MENLHLASDGLPVIPVYAGPGNSRRVLDDIGCLSMDDSIQAVTMMLDHFRSGRKGTPFDRPEIVARRSDAGRSIFITACGRWRPSCYELVDDWLMSILNRSG